MKTETRILFLFFCLVPWIFFVGTVRVGGKKARRRLIILFLRPKIEQNSNLILIDTPNSQFFLLFPLLCQGTGQAGPVLLAE
jgi:hypothetical protein